MAFTALFTFGLPDQRLNSHCCTVIITLLNPENNLRSALWKTNIKWECRGCKPPARGMGVSPEVKENHFFDGGFAAVEEITLLMSNFLFSAVVCVIIAT